MSVRAKAWLTKGGLCAAAVLLVLIITLPNIRAKREEAFQEEGA